MLLYEVLHLFGALTVHMFTIAVKGLKLVTHKMSACLGAKTEEDTANAFKRLILKKKKKKTGSGECLGEPGPAAVSTVPS